MEEMELSHWRVLGGGISEIKKHKGSKVAWK